MTLASIKQKTKWDSKVMRYCVQPTLKKKMQVIAAYTLTRIRNMYYVSLPEHLYDDGHLTTSLKSEVTNETITSRNVSKDVQAASVF